MANREEKWVEKIKDLLNEHFKGIKYHAETQVGLPYDIMLMEFKKIDSKKDGHLNLTDNDKSKNNKKDSFTTDLLIYEDLPDGNIIPRVVIEAKIKDATTHDVITYAKKAIKHRALMPALRYGLMIGANNSESLTWKHFAHGTDFDFMFSFRTEEPDNDEQAKFCEILDAEIECSQELGKIFESKNKNFGICCVHRKLEIKYGKE